jgi:adenylosuccinate lyase
VSGGLTRDVAYRVVQEAAATAWSERRPFRSVLEDDDRVTLSARQLDDAFGLERSLRHAGGTFVALEEVET